MNPFKLFYYWLFDIKPCEHHWETDHKETKCAMQMFEERGRTFKEGLTYDVIMGLTQYNTITTSQCSECGEFKQIVTPNNSWKKK